MDDFVSLTRAATEGDREAIDRLLERCLPELRAFVRLRAGAVVRRQESESDLVQSVCREVLQNADRFQHPTAGAFKRWLYTTALRKILDRREHHMAVKRDVHRNEPFNDADEAQHRLLETYGRFSSPTGKALVRDEIERVEGAMDALTEEQREVVTLAHLVGLSRAEIAEQLGKSEGAVRTTLYRAMAVLALALSEDDGDAG